MEYGRRPPSTPAAAIGERQPRPKAAPRPLGGCGGRVGASQWAPSRSPRAALQRTAPSLALDRQPMNLIRAQLGHSSLATTNRYHVHVAPAEFVKAMQARTWSL